MIEVRLNIDDAAGGEGDLARRLVSDLNDSRGLKDARLERRPAAPGERGIVEVVGSLVVTILNGSGAQALVEVIRAILGPRSGTRKVSVTLPDGSVFNLEGDGLSEDQFARAADAALEVFAGRAGG